MSYEFDRLPKEFHGMSNTPTYRTWVAMRQRCCDPNHPAYVRYGGRGVTVCVRWRDSFVAFVEDMGQRPEGKSIDRIDNNGNYEPNNCRWATVQEQTDNRRPHETAFSPHYPSDPQHVEICLSGEQFVKANALAQLSDITLNELICILIDREIKEAAKRAAGTEAPQTAKEQA